MKLDFDVENIRKNKIELLDCQVDLILRSLEFYAYTYEFIYPRFGDSVSKEENLRVSLVIDTYLFCNGKIGLINEFLNSILNFIQ